MFANIKDYITDPAIEQEGVNLSFGQGRFITILRAGGSNTAYNTYSAFQFKKHAKELKHGELEEAQAAEIMYDIYATKVVVGWKGWVGNDGQEIPFSIDACKRLFRESKEIYRVVREESENLDNFRYEEVVESGKE